MRILLGEQTRVAGQPDTLLLRMGYEPLSGRSI